MEMHKLDFIDCFLIWKNILIFGRFVMKKKKIVFNKLDGKAGMVGRHSIRYKALK